MMLENYVFGGRNVHAVFKFFFDAYTEQIQVLRAASTYCSSKM